jgi:hypothetical protein
VSWLIKTTFCLRNLKQGSRLHRPLHSLIRHVKGMMTYVWEVSEKTVTFGMTALKVTEKCVPQPHPPGPAYRRKLPAKSAEVTREIIF